MKHTNQVIGWIVRGDNGITIDGGNESALQPNEVTALEAMRAALAETGGVPLGAKSDKPARVRSHEKIADDEKPSLRTTTKDRD